MKRYKDIIAGRNAASPMIADAQELVDQIGGGAREDIPTLRATWARGGSSKDPQLQHPGDGDRPWLGAGPGRTARGLSSGNQRAEKVG